MGVAERKREMSDKRCVGRVKISELLLAERVVADNTYGDEMGDT
jgi:hypothetical protein